MTKIDKIKELTENLLKYCHEYYDLDNPSISDQEYDKLYDELRTLEDENDFWLSNSPTRKVQGLVSSEFTKIKHSKPMLSADKTKDLQEIDKFLKSCDCGSNYYKSFKLDGLTLVLRYKNGEFIQAITRGDGTYGEDVTEQAKMIENMPIHINYFDDLELRCECVVNRYDFDKINENLINKFKHPRNYAAGSIRQLDSNITKARKLHAVVFETVFDINNIDNKYECLDFLDTLGFETVKRSYTLDLDPNIYEYPADGIIFEVNSKKLSKMLGKTEHHENCRMALKWEDAEYETVLREVEWRTGRTGVISPVAIFDEIDLDGALTSRASLHNISIINNLEIGLGDTIKVIRANMVIPKITDNLTRSGNLCIPKVCPHCGCETEIVNTGSSDFLYCTNEYCGAKLLSMLNYFVSKKCMDIDGLSEATLQFLIDNNKINNFVDLYKLKDNYGFVEEWKNTIGFGEKSVNNILNSIEKSKDVKLDNFINSLGIKNIGYKMSKNIASHTKYDKCNFIELITSDNLYNELCNLNDIGPVASKSFSDYFSNDDRLNLVLSLLDLFNIIGDNEVLAHSNTLNNANFCITGKLNIFENRDALINSIESNGGHFISSVNSNCNYLINNDVNSNSSKNKKAKQLNIKIISEQDYMEMIKVED